MTSIIKLVLGWILKAIWGQGQKWYDEEMSYQQHKTVLIQQAKTIAREKVNANAQIAATPESVDDSLLRLARFAEGQSSDGDSTSSNRNLFAEFIASRAAADSGRDSGSDAEVPSAQPASPDGDQQTERLGTEHMGPATDGAVPTTKPGVQ